MIYRSIRYYHAYVDETRRMIKELIKEGEWNYDEFRTMKQSLLNKLNIREKSDQELLSILEQKIDDVQLKMSSSQDRIEKNLGIHKREDFL